MLRLAASKTLFTGMIMTMGLLLLVAAIYVNHVVQDRNQSALFAETQQQLSRYHNQLVTNLQNHIQIVRGLPGLFAVNPALTQAEFEIAMAHLLDGQNQLRNIAAAPDMVIRYMYPVAGNEAAIGLNYQQSPEQFAAAERARTSGRLVLAGPLQLRQGGNGLITRIPVFLAGEQEDKFWGIISAVIDSDAFFKASGLVAGEMPVELAIRGKDGLGEDGDMVWGDAALFEDPQLTMQLDLPDGYWQMVAQPIGGWQFNNQMIWQIRVKVFGAALAVFALLTAFIRFMFTASLANLKFRNLIESSPIPYLLINRKKQLSFINQAFTDNYQYQLTDLPWLEDWWAKTDISQPIRQQLNKWCEDAIVPELLAQTPTEIKIDCNDGSQRVALLSASALQDTFSDELLLVVYDITVRKAAEKQLRFATQIFEQAHEGIMVTDTDGKILDVNPAFSIITGYSREQVIGQSTSLLKSGKHDADFYAAMWRDIDKYGFWQGEIWNRRRNGELYAELLTISAMTGGDDSRQHYVGLFSDITQAKKQQEALELMAHYDVLTGLPNRVLFADRFTQAIAHSKRTKTWLGICFMDLDDFKPINDTHGHNVGDKVLVQVAQRLNENVREEDTLSRFGGDEFAIIFRDIESYTQCEHMLTRIHQALAEPYQVGNLQLKLSASSGVAIYPLDDADLDTLLRHADQAMYQAKLTGRNTYRLFNPQQNQQTIEKHALLVALRQAINADELTLFYQPEINMRTGQVVGIEALLRWQHPQKGLIPPATFLPVINGTELEILVGNWVIRHALKQLAELQTAGHDVFVSINIAPSHIQTPGFTDNLTEALANYPQIPPKRLQLEILETSALGDVRAISQILRTCREQIGVQVALDDFGTGYSSLTHLRHLAANSVKIDQSFVRDMLDDPNDFNIIEGVVGLAKAFNRQVVAEGVESIDHGKMLLLLNCDLAQGYAIAKPMPAEALAEWLDNFQAEPAWLALAAENLSPAQRGLRLWSLIIGRWQQQLQDCADSANPADNLPVLDSDRCHCGSYLAELRQQQMLPAELLNQLEQLHKQLHDRGLKLKLALEQTPDLVVSELQHFNAIAAELKQAISQYS
ncbi:MAG: EAL domain-containing protein [Methylophaga sp.]|nr:EAL domain-containing protein [Methylophaga sp.]